jgi:phosphate transport system ATP-binding protein
MTEIDMARTHVTPESPYPPPPGKIPAATAATATAVPERDLALDPGIVNPILSIDHLSLWYGQKQALKDITLCIPEKKITAFIGPSGCGKSTLLRCINRLNDLVDGVRTEGEILFEGGDIQDPEVDINLLRKRIGMFFQKSNPFPKSIYENVAFGLRLRGITRKSDLDARVESALKGAALWDETKDRLRDSAYALSGGQQQRLCIARSLACDPEIILFDEPTSALDPTATSRIEDLILELKDTVTILIVTHNMQQAARVSNETIFMYLGEVAEAGATADVFQNPTNKLTQDYITGHFG